MQSLMFFILSVLPVCHLNRCITRAFEHTTWFVHHSSKPFFKQFVPIQHHCFFSISSSWKIFIYHYDFIHIVFLSNYHESWNIILFFLLVLAYLLTDFYSFYWFNYICLNLIFFLLLSSLLGFEEVPVEMFNEDFVSINLLLFSS